MLFILFNDKFSVMTYLYIFVLSFLSSVACFKELHKILNLDFHCFPSFFFFFFEGLYFQEKLYFVSYFRPSVTQCHKNSSFSAEGSPLSPTVAGTKGSLDGEAKGDGPTRATVVNGPQQLNSPSAIVLQLYVR